MVFELNYNRIFIVIVSFNGSRYIKKCLQTVGDGFNVIVVDNCSTDETREVCREFSLFELITLSSNIGFGQANNIGINKALSEGAEYVFLLNQDAYLEKDCVEKLIEVHKINRDYGILSPVHLTGKGDELDYNFDCYLDNIYNSKWKLDLLLGTVKDVYALPFVNAAGWLIPRATLEKVGLFDPMFFHYGEDDNYCQRVRYHGLKIGVVPEARLLHDREGRINVLRNQNVIERRLKIELGNINMEYNLAKKKYNLKNLFKAFWLLNWNAIKFEFLHLRLLSKISKEIIESRKRNKNSYYSNEN